MYEHKIAVYYIFVYIFCIQILTTNSRTSTLWKLNNEEGKIISVSSYPGKVENCCDTNEIGAGAQDHQFHEEEEEEDSIFNIITSTTTNYENTWSKQPRDKLILNLSKETNHENLIKNTSAKPKGSSDINSDILDCGKPVNFTYYDDLIGVAQRFNHPIVPEPEVAYLFLKNKGSKSLQNFDIEALERRLKTAKREKPRSVQLYNQIGNFWRIKGDAQQSIECFRRALAIAPTNAEVLLNLARVLFNLQYLDDAIHLTRRSLEVQPPGRSAWRQYFTLGEIFKAYGHFQESINHLRQALELFPQYEPIKKAIADVENIPTSPLHVCTILIIVFLVMCVLYVILSSNDGNQSTAELEPKVPRHFNRAMAMRSLKGFTQRSIKNRK